MRRSRHYAAAVLAGALALGAGAGVGAAAAAAAPSGTIRIVGGRGAPITSYPFQAGLFIQEQLLGVTASEAFCGGVVIDPVQVVTAAHCVINEYTGSPVGPGDVTVMTGTATLPQNTPNGPTASAITVDPSYNANTNQFDVAVVTLPQPMYGGSPRPNGKTTIAPAPLITPALAAEFANPNARAAEAAMISGWGLTSPQTANQQPSGSQPTQLQAARIHFVPDATCAADYRGFGETITPQMICAGDPGKDSCFGDSGGPLVVDVGSPADPPRDLALAGTTDFGAGCAQPGAPGVYVRIADPSITAFIQGAVSAAGQHLTAPPTPTARALRLVSKRCTPTKCVVSSAPSSGDAFGIRSVDATLVLRATTPCVRHGHKTRCKHVTRRHVTLHRARGHYTAKIDGLKPATKYKLELAVIPDSWAVAPRPLDVALHTKRR